MKCPSCHIEMKECFSDGLSKAFYSCSYCKLQLLWSGQQYYWWSTVSSMNPQEVNYPMPFEVNHPGVEFVKLLKDASDEYHSETLRSPIIGRY